MRDRIRRLLSAASSEGIRLRLRDGGVRVFDDMQVEGEMFLTHYELALGRVHDSEVLAAVRAATPRSRAEFEAKYGPIEMTETIIASEDEGGWVEVLTLTEDGRVEVVHHEGDSPEAERIREEARTPL